MSKKYFSPYDPLAQEEKKVAPVKEEQKTVSSPPVEESTVPATDNGIQSKIKGVVVNAQKVRLRKEPSLSAPVLRILDEGHQVTVIHLKREGFYKVLDGNTIGYIHHNYLNLLSP